MIHPFAKLWLEATIAPESITNLKSDTIKHNYLDIISNEDKTLKVYVLSTDTEVIALGSHYNKLLLSSKYSFKDALEMISKELKLIHIK